MSDRVHGARLETLVCTRRGHVAPALDVRTLREDDAAVGVDTSDGRRFARCLRCDVWLAVPADDLSPSRAELPATRRLDLPRRGPALRDAVVLRLIAVERIVHVVVFAAAAAAFLYLALRLTALRSEAEQLVEAIDNSLVSSGRDGGRVWIARQLEKVPRLRENSLLVLAGTAAAYAVLEAVEAVGLWRERRWAEYLAAVATAGFLPFEIYELTERITWIRVAALVVNVAVLAWLLWQKRLFGIRGGAAALPYRYPTLDPVRYRPVTGRGP